MSWNDWALLGIFIVGFLLFLIGANLTVWNGTAASTLNNSIIGYSGVYLCIGSIASYLIIYIFKELRKKKPC